MDGEFISDSQKMKNIAEYFRSHTPEEIHNASFDKVITYIQTRPYLAKYFEDRNFFRHFHRTLIKQGYEGIEFTSRANNLPEYCYGRFVDVLSPEIQVYTDTDFEKHLNENTLFQGLEGCIDELEENSLDYL